jgi:hypothetical protein
VRSAAKVEFPETTDSRYFANESDPDAVPVDQMEYASDEPIRFEKVRQWRGLFAQWLGLQYSFVGRHQKALETFDEVLSRPSQMPRPNVFDGFDACGAVEAILELAD